MLAFGLLFCEFLGLMVPDPTKKYKDAKDTETWRIIFGLGLIAPVLQATLIPILFRFESPYFLITKGRSQEVSVIIYIYIYMYNSATQL